MDDHEIYEPLKISPLHPDGCHIDEIRLNENRVSRLKKNTFSFNGYDYNYYIDGKIENPAIFTVHDVGLVPEYAFGIYFSLKGTKPILNEFCVIHIGLPGQVESDPCLKSYPTFDDMALAICELIKHTKKKYSVGFGIGAGANLLIRVHLNNKILLSRLIFVNGYANSMSWSEWFNQKYSMFDISDSTLTHRVRSYLYYHFFGDVETMDYCYTYYNEYLDSVHNAGNLRLLLDSFARRSDIQIKKSESLMPMTDMRTCMKNSITCPVLLIISEDMPHSEDCYLLKELIDPTLVECVDFKNAHGLILNQYPIKITHAIILFLQGLGYLRGVDKPTIAGLSVRAFSTESSNLI